MHCIMQYAIFLLMISPAYPILPNWWPKDSTMAGNRGGEDRESEQEEEHLPRGLLIVKQGRAIGTLYFKTSTRANIAQVSDSCFHIFLKRGIVCSFFPSLKISLDPSRWRIVLFSQKKFWLFILYKLKSM